MLEPDSGSFRDRSSRVYIDGDRVLRALSATASDELDALQRSKLYARVVGAGKLVRTDRLPGAPADHGIPGDWAAVVEHPRLDVWTYPYEWSFTMLKDAALLQLELLQAALAEDLTLKDATPYNIQFDGPDSVFIDIGSFERLREGEPWYGYLQFCQLFLYPLLFQAYADLPFQPWLRASVDGIPPDQASRVLGPLRVAKKGVLVHVTLHARMQDRFSDTDEDVKESLQASGFKKELIEANVARLIRLVRGLQWKRSESTWSDYSDRSHYTDRDLEAKQRFVADIAKSKHWSLVWDVGCNDGLFSRLVAPHANRVLAFDNDALVVDVLYRQLRDEQITNVVPAVVNLADPSPGLGWRGAERAPFLERNRPDLALFLAVVHHLAITSNVPTSEVLDLIRWLDCRAVVEFPTRDDPMVKTLLRNKAAGTHDDYSLEQFEREVEERFVVERREQLASGTRVLFELRPR